MKPLDEVLNDLEVRNHEFRIKIILTFYTLETHETLFTTYQ